MDCPWNSELPGKHTILRKRMPTHTLGPTPNTPLRCCGQARGMILIAHFTFIFKQPTANQEKSSLTFVMESTLKYSDVSFYKFSLWKCKWTWISVHNFHNFKNFNTSICKAWLIYTKNKFFFKVRLRGWKEKRQVMRMTQWQSGFCQEPC